MNDDAFARRFYADRAELESLGITLQVEKPGESLQGYESELYSLPPGELLPAGDPVRRRRAGGAADRAAAARRRVRLRRAAAPRAAAGLLGPPEPADRGRAVLGRGADDGLGRRRRALAAPLEDRDRDLAPQDDRVHLLHDRARLAGEAQGRPLPPGLPRRPVLFDRPLARARRGAGLPPLADPGQGLLRLEGRARLLAARGLRPPRLRPPRRLAARRDRGRRRRSSSATGSPGWSSATSAPTASSATPAAATARPGKGRIFETEYASSRQMVAWVLRWRQNATVLDPPELAEEVARAPRAAQRAPRGRLRARRRRSGPCRPPPRAARSNGRSEAAIRPERFARLVTLAGMLIESAKGEARLPVADVTDRLARHRRGAARGHRPAQRRQLRRRHLRPLRRAPGRRDRGRLRALRRQLRPAGAAAAARGEGAGRGDRPLRRPPAAERPRERPQEDRQGARPRPLRGGARDRRRPAATTPTSPARSTRRSRASGCSRSSTTRRTRTSSPSARSSPTGSRTDPRAGTSPPTTAAARTSATSGSTGSRRPRSRRRASSPAPRSRRSPRSRAAG